MKREEFDEVYALLKSAFPPDERRDYVGQRALLEQAQYRIYVADDDGIAGFLALWQLREYCFVEHFAVREDRRGQGLGSQMLAALREKTSCPICLEAELPITPIAARRIDFYKRNGFFVNEYPYVQPPFSLEKNPVELYVLTTGGALDVRQFAYLKEQIYKTVYKKETK